MKKTTRAIALILVLIMTFSLVSGGVLADSAKSELYDEDLAALYGDGFLILGDSYARGMGGTDDWDSLYMMDNVPGEDVYQLGSGKWLVADKECRNIEGSYSKLIADALGCNCPNDITDTSATYWPIAHNALTLGAVMDLCGIEDNFFDDTFYHKIFYCRDRYDADLYYFGSTGKSTNADNTGTFNGTPAAKDVNEIIGDAKLITVALGMGDIFNRTYATLNNSGMLDNISDAASVANVLKYAIQLLNEGFEYWETYFPVFINYIKRLNPDATIVAVGAVNTFFGTTITKSTLAPIGTAFSALSVKMNRQLKEFCEQLDLMYVDISNVETGVSTEEMDIAAVFADIEPATHPTKRGHQQIAQMILDALREYNGLTETAKRDIRLDIGRYDSLDYVMVNGVYTTDYELDGHILTVHCNTVLANNLTIGAKLNGKVSVTTYQVVYEDGGYTAYRMYTTNNVFRVIDNVVASIKGKLSGIFSKISY